MELLGEKQIAAISEALAQRLLETCHLDGNSLIFDCTNFDTFIDTENRSRLPQRGHAKSKRTDLRIVGLALLVSVDFHVPLLWKVYPGNQQDSLTFAQALKDPPQRYQALARHCQSMTWIFDKGNNSARNQEILDASRFHFVGSLIPTHFTDLLALPVEKFQKLKDARLKSTRALRLTRQVWGQERTLVITFSPELQRKQIRGIEQHLSKKRRICLRDRKSTRLNSSHGYISYAVFCLKKKKKLRVFSSLPRRLEPSYLGTWWRQDKQPRWLRVRNVLQSEWATYIRVDEVVVDSLGVA